MTGLRSYFRRLNPVLKLALVSAMTPAFCVAFTAQVTASLVHAVQHGAEKAHHAAESEFSSAECSVCRFGAAPRISGPTMPELSGLAAFKTVCPRSERSCEARSVLLAEARGPPILPV